MKFFYIILYTIFFTYTSKAQFEEKDSLLQIITSNANDSIKSDAYNEFAFYMFDYNVDSSILLANKAKQLAFQSGSVRQEARAIKNIGISFDIKGKTDSAIYYLSQALEIAKKNQLHPSQANILTDIANAWYAAGSYELALRNHFEALRLRESYGARKEIAQSYNNIALVYRSRKDYANAIQFNQLSLAIKKELNNKQGIINSYINIGSCYQYMGKYDSALYFANNVMKTAFVPQDIHEGKANYATALIGLKRFKEAEKIWTALLPELDAEEEQAAIIAAHMGFGNIALQQNKTDAAIDWYRKGINYAQRFNDRENKAAFFKSTANAFEQKKDYANAYYYSSLHETLKDSLLNEENSRQINEMKAVYEKEKQQVQIGELTNKVSTTQEKAAKNLRQRNIFLLITISLIVLTLFGFYTFRIIKRKNALLGKQKNEIENALKEKDILMREIHHRVKNNLQVVTSLLNLQSHYISDKNAYSAIQAGKNRVQSMALIHQFLYRDVSSLTALRIKDYVKELLNYIEETNEEESRKIKVVQNVDDIELDIDTVVPLGLIINELVTNAFKYAFVNVAEGLISVSFTRQSDTNSYLLRVSDNGVGMDTTLIKEKSTSFGYRMIKAFVEKMEGSLEFDTQNGTIVSLFIPIIKPV